jgi:hypothetical protein
MNDEKIIDAEGHFHAEDEAVDLSPTIAEGWIALAIFWMLGLTVFYQFITRYVMNDSAAWTEEVARYMLIAVVFIGAAVGVAKNNQIQVDFFYRHMPAAMGRWISRAVDVLRTAFFVAAVVHDHADDAEDRQHHAHDHRRPADEHRLRAVPVRLRAMTWRSMQVARIHWKRGYSVLERPNPRCQTTEPDENTCMLKIILPRFHGGGIPVAMAMAGASLPTSW